MDHAGKGNIIIILQYMLELELFPVYFLLLIVLFLLLLIKLLSLLNFTNSKLRNGWIKWINLGWILTKRILLPHLYNMLVEMVMHFYIWQIGV
jgi:hypothetical protein